MSWFALVTLVALARPEGVLAQDVASGPSEQQEAPKQEAPKADRIFGVLPNYATVEQTTRIEPLKTGHIFKLAAENSFDPFVFPFIGVVAAMNRGGGGAYEGRYATALADNSIGNFMTSAILPSALRQDPRYFALEHGTAWHRAGYALSRSVVTRSLSGRAEFNYSEIGGNAIASVLSNAYYAAPERTIGGTLTRWGMQVMWDTMSNELKEFWPDIRQRMPARKR